MEFHISRQSRDKFQFEDTLFALDGNVLFADLYAVRLFTSKINQQRDLIHFPEQTARAGQLNALGLMDEIFHYVFFLFRQQKNPQLIEQALTSVSNILGSKEVDEILSVFIKEFPPSVVYKKQLSAEEYLSSDTKGVPNRFLVTEELILYWVTQHNPALNQYTELFDSPILTENRKYQEVINQLQIFFSAQPGFGPENLTMLELLRSPARHVPHSLTGQLEYIRDHWATLLGEYFYRLLTGLDLLKEENKLSFTGPGPVQVPQYDPQSLLAFGLGTGEVVAFSQDKDWMAGLVLIAKNTYVWLDQLSQKYQRQITHLDQIPEEELQQLAKSGITGLWLIGLWERSQASARIKQLCGNPDAIASAYSLYSYQIARDLGGAEAYEMLRDSAARFGIRLASDMVPNHMGIDSEWVNKHPERFLSVEQCPYPNYSFNGPDLSSDPAITVQIEDHYFTRTDAAVVFKRYDHRSGQTRYIYHGNDGTSMPWNDTAQLNYLSAEVQEAVYQTILEVARKFPIIRFDAAMTLAKKQVQRLWFPEPGSGGAIPSRSEYALTREQFNAAMPKEFWRMVVDRIAVDAPDTLLLAEAFWMMEGYFVRTLGMHRVYNSAFMHMLRDENNSGYRQLIKNTLEFEPEILKRYVNFMNNPDEKTAIEQFGNGDKYFGVCTLMATFPGLPMLGHGQIEGFAEKYGMEYHHAYMEEKVDGALVERHQREIFPLLQRRRLFAGVENFWLFDFFSINGHVNENVFAFTNAYGKDHALVIVNNSLHSSEGWLHVSSARLVNGNLQQLDLSEALSVDDSQAQYLIFRDQVSGLQFIRPLAEIKEKGFHIQLQGYEHHVFMDFRLVSSDSKHDYHRLYEYLGEGGIPEIETGISELFIQPVLKPFREIANAGYVKYLIDLHNDNIESLPEKVFKEFKEKTRLLLAGIESVTGQVLPNKNQYLENSVLGLRSLLSMKQLINFAASTGMQKLKASASYLSTGLSDKHLTQLLVWLFIGKLGQSRELNDEGMLSLSWAEEWQLTKVASDLLRESGWSEQDISQSLTTLRLLISQQGWFRKMRQKSSHEIASAWLADPEVQTYLHINRFQGILWFDNEAMKDFLWWMCILAYLDNQMQSNSTSGEGIQTLMEAHAITSQILKTAEKSEYQVEKLLDALEG